MIRVPSEAEEQARACFIDNANSWSYRKVLEAQGRTSNGQSRAGRRNYWWKRRTFATVGENLPHGSRLLEWQTSLLCSQLQQINDH